MQPCPASLPSLDPRRLAGGVGPPRLAHAWRDCGRGHVAGGAVAGAARARGAPALCAPADARARGRRGDGRHAAHRQRRAGAPLSGRRARLRLLLEGAGLVWGRGGGRAARRRAALCGVRMAGRGVAGVCCGGSARVCCCMLYERKCRKSFRPRCSGGGACCAYHLRAVLEQCYCWPPQVCLRARGASSVQAHGCPDSTCSDDAGSVLRPWAARWSAVSLESFRAWSEHWGGSHTWGASLSCMCLPRHSGAGQVMLAERVACALEHSRCGQQSCISLHGAPELTSMFVRAHAPLPVCRT